MMNEGQGRQVRDVLETLGAAIRRADFDRLQGCAATLERLMPGLSGCSGADAAAIRSLARRNAACLKGMAEGLRIGQRRLREIASAAQGETYDERGQRRKISPDHQLRPGGQSRRI